MTNYQFPMTNEAESIQYKVLGIKHREEKKTITKLPIKDPQLFLLWVVCCKL